MLKIFRVCLSDGVPLDDAMVRHGREGLQHARWGQQAEAGSPDAAQSLQKGSESLQSSGLMVLLWSASSSSHSGWKGFTWILHAPRSHCKVVSTCCHWVVPCTRVQEMRVC